MTIPTISVVIPCYNGAKFLRETLDSILAQTLPPLEVLVIDDGSTDDSAAIAESYGPPVRVIRQPNQGESVARNRGIDEAQGEWVAFCDADDLWLPTKLEEQANVMGHHIEAITTVCEIVREDQTTENKQYYIPKSEWFSRQWILENGVPCHISTLAIRRLNTIRFPVGITYGEDLYFFLDLDCAKSIAIAEKPLVVYRLHSGGQTATADRQIRWNATARKWLEINREQLSKPEYAQLQQAFARRELRTTLAQAVALRQQRKPLASLRPYFQVMTRGLLTSSAMSIVLISLRSSFGAIAESLRLRKHPIQT